MSESLYAFEKCKIPSFEERESKPYDCSVTLKNGETLELSVSSDKTGSTVSLKTNEKYQDVLKTKNIGNHSKLIDNLFVDRIDNLLIMFYEVGDSLGVSSEAAAFSMHNFKRKWKTDLWGFNLAVARKGDVAFTSTAGFAAKINLKSGKFLWKHNLRGKREFNGGGEIVVESNVVRFSNNMGKPLLIDEKTGKIIN